MRLRHLLTLLFLIASSVVPCLGQMSGGMSDWTFQVVGSVRDSDTNRPIAGIRVSLLNMGTPQASTLTSTDGNFAFSGIHNGRYGVQISVEGYETFEQDVVVNRGSVSLYVDLVRAIGAAPPPTGPSVSVHELGVPPKALREYDKAFVLMSAKADYRGAIDGFDRAIQDYPNYYEAYAMEGAAYLALSDATSAEKVLRKSIDLSSSKYPDPLYLLAGLLNAANRYAEAEGTAEQCIGLEETSWRGYFELARAQLGLGNLDEAQTSALKSRDLKPDNPRIFLLLANIHTAQHDYTALLNDLEKFLALNPSGPTADQVRKEREQVQQALAAQAGDPPPPQPAGAPPLQPQQ